MNQGSPGSHDNRPTRKRVYEILLVDDNPADSRLIEEIWRTSIQVESRLNVLNDSRQALPYLRRESPFTTAELPDLILLDYHMPTDGGEALQLIRSEPEFTHLPIIVLTGTDSPAALLDIYRRHANCCLRKTSALDELEATLDEVARHWLGRALLPPKNDSLSIISS